MCSLFAASLLTLTGILHQTSSTLKDTLEEHFLVWPSDSFPDLIQSMMGPRQAIDVPRDSITVQTRPWPTSNGSYIAKFRGIWNLRSMAMKQLKSLSEPEDVVAVSFPILPSFSNFFELNAITSTAVPQGNSGLVSTEAYEYLALYRCFCRCPTVCLPRRALVTEWRRHPLP